MSTPTEFGWRLLGDCGGSSACSFPGCPALANVVRHWRGADAHNRASYYCQPHAYARGVAVDDGRLEFTAETEAAILRAGCGLYDVHVSEGRRQ